MLGDRKLVVVLAVGVLLAAAVALLVEPLYAPAPLVLAVAAVVLLQRRGAQEWDEEWDEDDEGYEPATDDDAPVSYAGPSSGGLAVWTPDEDLVHREPTVDYESYEPAAASGGSDQPFDPGALFGDEPQEFEPLPIWNTFETESVVEDVQSDDDILAASQQSALHMTEDLSEDEVQHVNQELLSKVHSLLAKYE